MYIRKTTMNDLDSVCYIYEGARAFMKESGNPTQWGDVHPRRELIVQDINEGKSYVCVDENARIIAVLYFCVEVEPTYAKIAGQWLNDEPYGVIHRIAKDNNAPKGTGTFCIDWCFEQHDNVRIDTHKDNIPMIKLLEKLDFTYCGIIWVGDGSERMAYQRMAYQKEV